THKPPDRFAFATLGNTPRTTIALVFYLHIDSLCGGQVEEPCGVFISSAFGSYNNPLVVQCFKKGRPAVVGGSTTVFFMTAKQAAKIGSGVHPSASIRWVTLTCVNRPFRRR